MPDTPETVEDARNRFRTAVQGLVCVYGRDRVAAALGGLLGLSKSPDRKTIANWSEGRTVADYHVAVVLIACYDRERLPDTLGEIASA